MFSICRQFNVPSVNFPGQTHVWKLNTFFQKGIDTAREEYLDGIAFALRFVVVFAPRLLTGESLSAKDALRSIKTDIVELLGKWRLLYSCNEIDFKCILFYGRTGTQSWTSENSF